MPLAIVSTRTDHPLERQCRCARARAQLTPRRTGAGKADRGDEGTRGAMGARGWDVVDTVLIARGPAADAELPQTMIAPSVSSLLPQTMYWPVGDLDRVAPDDVVAARPAGDVAPDQVVRRDARPAGSTGRAGSARPTRHRRHSREARRRSEDARAAGCRCDRRRGRSACRCRGTPRRRRQPEQRRDRRQQDADEAGLRELAATAAKFTLPAPPPMRPVVRHEVRARSAAPASPARAMSDGCAVEQQRDAAADDGGRHAGAAQPHSRRSCRCPRCASDG